jgi:hypothetical protein
VDKMLNEYYEKFYGPAASIMKEAFDYAEKTHNILRLDTRIIPKANKPTTRVKFLKGGKGITSDLLHKAKTHKLAASVKFLELLHKAKAAAGADTVYGKRIAFIINEYVPLEKTRIDLAVALTGYNPRRDAPLIVGTSGSKESASYQLVVTRSGKEPTEKTSFKVRWDKDNLIFDVKCEESDMKNLLVSEDVRVGDYLGVTIETEGHSYYQVAVNPDGKIYDADRQNGRVTKWESLAFTETEKGKEFWRIKLTIPIVTPENNAGDPYHYVVGNKPTRERMWYINVGRVRVRKSERSEKSTFIPRRGPFSANKHLAKLVIE